MKIILDAIELLKGFFGNGGPGNAVGNTIANGAALAALIAALAPAALWLVGHRDETAVSFTFGQLSVIGLAAAVLLKVIHYSRPGSIKDRDSQP